jgi:hypothetical protein
MTPFTSTTKLEATEKPMWHLIHDGVHVLDVHRTSGAVRNKHLVVRFSSLAEVKDEIAKLGLIAMPDRPQKIVRQASGEVFDLGLAVAAKPELGKPEGMEIGVDVGLEPVESEPVTESSFLRRLAAYVVNIPVTEDMMKEREALALQLDFLSP